MSQVPEREYAEDTPAMRLQAKHTDKKRARLFRFLLRCLDRHTPSVLRTVEIRILCRWTANAFHMQAPAVHTLHAGKALRQYAVFSQKCLTQPGADPAYIYRTARRLGRRLRRITGFSDSRDCARLVFWLYRGIGITMDGKLPGEITVSTCYFSRFYAPAQCALMSHMDSGIISGICGGGKLCFSRRITQGDDACRACLRGQPQLWDRGTRTLSRT